MFCILMQEKSWTYSYYSYYSYGLWQPRSHIARWIKAWNPGAFGVDLGVKLFCGATFIVDVFVSLTVSMFEQWMSRGSPGCSDWGRIMWNAQQRNRPWNSLEFLCFPLCCWFSLIFLLFFHMFSPCERSHLGLAGHFTDADAAAWLRAGPSGVMSCPWTRALLQEAGTSWWTMGGASWFSDSTCVLCKWLPDIILPGFSCVRYLGVCLQPVGSLFLLFFRACLFVLKLCKSSMLTQLLYSSMHFFLFLFLGLSLPIVFSGSPFQLHSFLRISSSYCFLMFSLHFSIFSSSFASEVGDSEGSLAIAGLAIAGCRAPRAQEVTGTTAPPGRPSAIAPRLLFAAEVSPKMRCRREAEKFKKFIEIQN